MRHVDHVRAEPCRSAFGVPPVVNLSGSRACAVQERFDEGYVDFGLPFARRPTKYAAFAASVSSVASWIGQNRISRPSPNMTSSSDAVVLP